MLKRILSIFLMLVILGLNSGLTFITHYCQGEAVESAITLFPSDLSCGMSPAEMQSCTNDDHGDAIQKKGCCENHYTSFSAESEYDSTPVVVNTHIDFKFVAAFVYSFVLNYTFAIEDKQFFESYHPPYIDKDISVLHQVFLI